LPDRVAFTANVYLDIETGSPDTADRDLERLAVEAVKRASLDMDTKKWFAPTAENFFSKVSKARITEALTEAGKPPTSDTARFKKADLAAFAEKEIQGTGWLPEPVRIPAVEDEEVGFSLHDESEDDGNEKGAQ
jgi:ParB family chromosome partitioning protein